MAQELLIPESWTVDQLNADRLISERLFTDIRREEGPRSFSRVYEALEPRVRDILKKTHDLREFHGQLFLDDPDAWQGCRYLCAPPISQEDLWTIVGNSKFVRVPPRLADQVADAMRVVLDPVRFPWLVSGRAPTEAEREAAIMSSTVLWSSQHLSTERRGESSHRQEAATAGLLLSVGMELEESRASINFIDDMRRGTYSKERRIAGAKCDVPIRLRDGRLLALECKVSNGPKNGWKRVVREVGGKADLWRTKFGSQILTGVVIAGVFDLSCLVGAQEAGVALFWEHDLSTLSEFVGRS